MRSVTPCPARCPARIFRPLTRTASSLGHPCRRRSAPTICSRPSSRTRIRGPSNSISLFAVVVPTNAIYATNILLFATLPVNLFYSTNVPPTNNYELLANRTNGFSVLSTNLATAPTNIVPGGIYFLGVQNTNSVPVTNAIEVDFALALPLSLPVIPDQVVTAGDTLIVTNTATDSSAGAVLVYNLSGSGAAAGGSISASGIITWVTDRKSTRLNSSH